VLSCNTALFGFHAQSFSFLDWRRYAFSNQCTRYGPVGGYCHENPPEQQTAGELHREPYPAAVCPCLPTGCTRMLLPDRSFPQGARRKPTRYVRCAANRAPRAKHQAGPWPITKAFAVGSSVTASGKRICTLSGYSCLTLSVYLPEHLDESANR